jgi:hypothetical protein
MIYEEAPEMMKKVVRRAIDEKGQVIEKGESN